MDLKKLQSTVVGALEDIKAQDIRVFDTVHLTSLFDRVAIASGTSNRQTKALAASVRDKVKAQGGAVLSVEGEDTGEWVLVDLGDMIVHIMQPAIRAYYRLEEIWGDKEVKLGAAKRAPRKTAVEAADGDAPAKKPSRHLAATREAEAEAPKKRAPRKTAAADDAGAAAPAKKAAPKTAVRKPAVKPVAKAAKATGMAAPKKTPVRRAPTKARTAE
ncbi:MAG: ribosome silencing factor [Burkholderiaceae bacterium]